MSWPIISAIETIPTDEASLEAVLGFIVNSDSRHCGPEEEAWSPLL
jgi:hypothetical protein